MDHANSVLDRPVGSELGTDTPRYMIESVIPLSDANCWVLLLSNSHRLVHKFACALSYHILLEHPFAGIMTL